MSRIGSFGLALAAAAGLSIPAPAEGAFRGGTPHEPSPSGWWLSTPRAPRPLSPLAWLTDELGRADHRMGAERELALLRRYANPRVERPGEWRTFWTGRYGFSTWWTGERLAWGSSETPAERALPTLPQIELSPVAAIAPPELGSLKIDVSPTWVIDANPVPAVEVEHLARTECAPWQRSVPVTIARHGAEHDQFRLLDCDGAIALDAIDRVSVLARPPNVPHPGLPLPIEPDATAAAEGEWVEGVRLVDPRLVWALAAIAQSFPGRVIYLISGYRRDAGESLHRKGRALDLFVMGVSNESVLGVCRKLKDVGCGYYPNNKFVHVDVRQPYTGHALWVDTAGPGQPSHYVDAWPGVVEGGALAWAGGEQ